jgi:outer membrane protein insertion porin family
MRLSTVTVCTLAALSTWDVSQNANAAIPEAPSTEKAADVVVATDEIEHTPIQTVAPPETIVSQQFSTTPKPSVTIAQDTSQYYQDYQPVAKSAPPVEAAQPSAIAPTASVKPPPPASINQPAWVIPQKNLTPPTVNPPAISTPKPIANPSPIPSDLVVTATDVQIVGAADPALQQIVRSAIRTQQGGGTSKSQLQDDVAAILETGLFSTASVTSRENPNGLSVTFQVQPIVVRSVQLVNAQALTPAVVNDIFRSQIGTIASPSALNQGVRQINQWYAQNNYNLARVVALQPSRDGVLTIEVAEGVIGDVQIRFTDEQGKLVDDKGNPIRGRTQESFIKQQVQIKPGQVFKEDLARQDLQRLVQTGLFTNARVSLEGDAKRTIVVYNLAEARTRAINATGGYNTDLGLYGGLNYQDRNIAGIGQQLSTNVLIGTKDAQFDGRFVSPYRANEPDKLGYSVDAFRRRGLSRVFDDKVKLANGDRVREGRFGGGVAVNRPIDQDWNGSLGLNYNRVSLRDASGNVVRRDRNGNPLSFSGTGIDDLVSLNFNAIRDKRDNVIDPTNGSFLSLSTEQFLPIGSGSILANRIQANYTQYVPVNILNTLQTKNEPETLAFNVQGGTTIGDLPPHNAYSLGGPNSVRGYDAGDVGISRSYVLASAEYRFPIYSIIGGALFADFASDLGSSASVLGQPGIERGRPGSGFGIGAGVRLKSPLGIIRADFGLNNQGDSRVQFGFGQKF